MKHTGPKYNPSLGTAEVAKLVRADIKRAIGAGEIPAIKTSVRIKRYSGGSSISVYITEAPYQIATDESVRAAKERPHDYFEGDHRTPESIRVARAIEAIMGEYNRTDIDSQSDLYNVKFHAFVDYDWRSEKAEKEAIWSRLCAAPTATVDAATAPPPADTQADFLAWAGA